MTDLSAAPLQPPPSRDSTRVDGQTIHVGPWLRWRWWLQSLQVSRAEREEANADAAIRERWGALTQPNVIAVLGAKGGSGKTTTAMIVADLLADRLRLRTLAVDLTTSPGALAALAPAARRSDKSVLDLIADQAKIGTSASFREYVATFPSGLHVLGAPADTGPMHNLTGEARDQLFGLLLRHYELVVVDLGDQVADPDVRATVRRADQCLVVSTPENVTSAMTQRLLSALAADAGDDDVTLAVNKCFVRGPKDLAEMERALHRSGLSVDVTIPFDFQLASMLDGGGFALDALDERLSRVAWKRLTSRIATRLM